MKNAYYTLIVLALGLLLNCAPGHQELLIAGNGPPGAITAGLCTYSPLTLGFVSTGTLFVEWQKAFDPPPAQQFHYLMGLTVLNTLDAQPLEDSTGQTLSTAGLNAVDFTEVDATFTTVPSGAADVPDVAIPTSGSLAAGASGVAVFDLMSGAASEALASATKSASTVPFTLLANITVKGITGGSSNVESNPFLFPIDINLAPLPLDPNGDGEQCGTATVGTSGVPEYQLSFSNSPCNGAPQDTASAGCAAYDAGA